MLVRPPFFAPHHDASKVALLGGGTGQVRPGEVSRSHCGVLFLDEFPLFRADAIEALRQPLESGDVTIARGDESATYPARGMVVMACNPCPCGNFHPDTRVSTCGCHPVRLREYRRKITGPITDRIDITRHLVPLRRHEAQDVFERPEGSAQVRARVTAARARQEARFHGRSWRLNGQAPGPLLRQEWPLSKECQIVLDDEVYDGRLSRRGATRVHRLAWTVADLAGADQPELPHLRTALRLRTGDPLELASLGMRAG
jgi:magnesium chelatase family protein